VKGPSLGIFRGARFVKVVVVRQEHNVNAIVLRRERFHLENSMLRQMRAKDVAFSISR
jgi:hypothetical protein